MNMAALSVGTRRRAYFSLLRRRGSPRPTRLSGRRRACAMAGLGAEAVESPGFADAFGLSEKCRVIRQHNVGATEGLIHRFTHAEFDALVERDNGARQAGPLAAA